MQIVIDITDDEYKGIKEHYDSLLFGSTVDIETYCIANGKPLDDVLKDIDIGISASTGTDDYMVGFRNGMKWVKSLFDGKDPDYDSCISGKGQE